MVDCSIGTPNDPPPPAVIEALASSGTERGYPASAGSPQLRDAAAAWLARRFGLPALAPSAVAACVGTKELVASVPHLLRLRAPGQGHGAVPRGVLSDLRHGGGAGRVPRRPGPGPGGAARGTRSRRHRPRRRRARPVALVELAVEPDRRPGGPRGGGGLGAGPRASPCSPTSATPSSPGTARPGRCSSTAPTAWSPCTPSPSARTWPACGSASTPGIPSWSSSSGPCASTPASWSPARRRPPAWRPWPTTTTWRPSGRATGSAWPSWPASSVGYGCPVAFPEGGFYLWVPVPAGRWPDAWAMAESLATDGGLLVSPGDLYGEDGAGHVRVAVVQPMERLALVGERLARAPERQAARRRGRRSTAARMAAMAGIVLVAAPVGEGERDGPAQVRPQVQAAHGAVGGMHIGQGLRHHRHVVVLDRQMERGDGVGAFGPTPFGHARFAQSLDELGWRRGRNG